MVPRYGVSVGIGLCVTFGLLFVMQLLIASGQGSVADKRSAHLVDFVRVVRNPTVERQRTKPEKPPEPSEQPDLPQSTTGDSFETGLTVSMTAPAIDGGVRLGGSGFSLGDGEYLPFVKVTPVYPRRAQERELEGYAVVEYTVTSLGTTRDIRLVESSNSVFDRPCLEAAEKFKYKPRTVNGETIDVPGVRNICTFELEN